MEPTTGKKIVSKGAYATLIARRMGSGIAAVILGLLAIGCAALAYRYYQSKPSWAVGVCLLASLGTCFFTYLYNKCIALASKKDAVVPLTRANTADLPAPDSLVRASSEPMQAQEAVLLRAAAEGQETPPEQLVRASVSFSTSRSGRPGQE